MLDLAKNYGNYDEILFFGDSERNDLVFYLPDEVGLSKSGIPGSEDYELMLQLFKEGQAIEGSIEDLDKNSGGILTLGVQCSVTPSRLENALKKLIADKMLPEGTHASLPPWKRGKVDLIVLDSTTQDENTLDSDNFVNGIIGSKSPSLLTSQLKSIFNVRLDSRGAALVASAFKGDRGHAAGVLYDLQFEAIHPALDLRIWADLERCYQTISHQLSIKAEFTYYVKFSLGADLEWVTQKMEENGDLKIEVLSQVSDPRMKELVDQTVKDTKEKVLRELFHPMVNPGTLGMQPVTLGLEEAIPKVGIAYTFKNIKGVQSKVIDIDFRERSAVIRTHNPQAHLWVMGEQVKDKLDRYTKTVTFSDVWRKHELEISLPHDFEKESNDLLAAEAVVWRKKDGLAEEGMGSGAFKVPSNASPLASITFTKSDLAAKKIAWTTDPGEADGYYYQIRFLFDTNIEDVDSPGEIITAPKISYSQDLPIILQGMTLNRLVRIKTGNIDFDKIKNVDVFLTLRDEDEKSLEWKQVILNAGNPNQKWLFRRPLGNNVFLQEQREYHFKENIPSIMTNLRYLQDDEVIVNNPLKTGGRIIFPIFAGPKEGLLKVIISLNYQPTGLDQMINKTIIVDGPGFDLEDIKLDGVEQDIPVQYEVTAIMDTGDLYELMKGILEEQALVIDLKELHKGELTVVWQGQSPEMLDLKYLLLEIGAMSDGSDDIEIIRKIKYTGDEQPEDQKVPYDRSKDIRYKITKRFFDGEKNKTDWLQPENDLITLTL
jgi:hypothetical protein